MATWILFSQRRDAEQRQDLFQGWRVKAMQWLLKKVADEKAYIASRRTGQQLDERTLRILINELNVGNSTLKR